MKKITKKMVLVEANLGPLTPHSISEREIFLMLVGAERLLMDRLLRTYNEVMGLQNKELRKIAKELYTS